MNFISKLSFIFGVISLSAITSNAFADSVDTFLTKDEQSRFMHVNYDSVSVLGKKDFMLTESAKKALILGEFTYSDELGNVIPYTLLELNGVYAILVDDDAVLAFENNNELVGDARGIGEGRDGSVRAPGFTAPGAGRDLYTISAGVSNAATRIAGGAGCLIVGSLVNRTPLGPLTGGMAGGLAASECGRAFGGGGGNSSNGSGSSGGRFHGAN